MVKLLNYQPRKRVTEVELVHAFSWAGQERHSGFGFDIDKETGKPVFELLIGGEFERQSDGYLHHIYGTGETVRWIYGTDLPEGFNKGDHPGIVNYENCINGEYDVVDHGIEERPHNYTEEAHGECAHCGTEVWLYNDYGHGIDCSGCNAIYSGTGQELAPRSQWEDRYDEDSTQPYNVEFGYSDY